MARRRPFRAIAVTCLMFAATPAWGWYPFSRRYEKWQKNRSLAMGGWHISFPRDHYADRVARYRAAGLNQFFGNRPTWATPYFKAAAEAGIQWQTHWHESQANLDKVLREIPGATAVIVVDEPNDRDAHYKRIEQRIAWVRKNHPHVLAFANLSIGEIKHDRYIRQCKPDVFCFDMYLLLANGTDTPSYLHHVGWGRRTSRQHRLPYWMILQAYGRTHEKPSYAYRIPDEADMRFLAFTLLAHGGTGMQFFVYYSKARTGMIRWTGADNEAYEHNRLNRSYFAVRDMAPEIQNLSRALLNLRSKGPLGYAGTIPQKCPAFGGHGRMASVAVPARPKDPILVGFFDDRSRQEYFMVVNLVHGLAMSKMDGVRTVRLTFGNGVEKIERLNRLTGLVETLRTTPGKGGGRILDVQLEGGTGDLFKWANGKPWALRKAMH